MIILVVQNDEDIKLYYIINNFIKDKSLDEYKD